MFFVEVRYHRDPDGAGGQVRYIAHREEGLTDGQRRQLYGIGERYRSFRGDERSIRKALRDDGRGLRNPVYFRFIMTVDNPTAMRFKRFDGHLSERILRDVVERTFRGAARGVQGVFAVHQHGGQDRPAHPHVHALLSPRFENRMAVHISPVRLQRIKARWEREVLYGLERQERRFIRTRAILARTPPSRPRDREERSPLPVHPARPRPCRDGQLELFATARRSLRLSQANGWTPQWLLFGRRCRRWEQDPERAARRAVFRLASRAMPKAVRDALWLLRGLQERSVRQR